MTTRRGFFGMLAGLVASPKLKLLEKFLPQEYTYYQFQNYVSYRVTYTVGPPPGNFRIKRIMGPSDYL
jgi:hypothetical protein